ncbi:MAG: hypothetical protein JSS72_01830 [Armatimonadetes bacterium]|nr:hypothetical protein [Armatimonadota bacterium]
MNRLLASTVSLIALSAMIFPASGTPPKEGEAEKQSTVKRTIKKKHSQRRQGSKRDILSGGPIPITTSVDVSRKEWPANKPIDLEFEKAVGPLSVNQVDVKVQWQQVTSNAMPDITKFKLARNGHKGIYTVPAVNNQFNFSIQPSEYGAVIGGPAPGHYWLMITYTEGAKGNSLLLYVTVK